MSDTTRIEKIKRYWGGNGLGIAMGKSDGQILKELVDTVNQLIDLQLDDSEANTDTANATLEAQEQIYNLVSKHFPNDKNFQAFYKEFAEIRKEME